MKNFLAKIKAFILAAIAWLCSWPKDLIIQFSLADNINTVVWVVVALMLGIFAPIMWVYAVSTGITLALLFYKRHASEIRVDWRNIVASGIGLLWSQLKIGLVYFCLANALN